MNCMAVSMSVYNNTNINFKCDNDCYRMSLGDRVAKQEDDSVISQSGSARGSMEMTFKLKKVNLKDSLWK